MKKLIYRIQDVYDWFWMRYVTFKITAQGKAALKRKIRMTITLEELKISFRQLTGSSNTFNNAMNAERCRDYGYYVGRNGLTHLQWRLWWNIPACLYYRRYA